jgi:cyclase
MIRPPAEMRLADDVFVWTLGGDEISTSYGSNCTAIVGNRSALLVDPFIAPAHARLAAQALAARTRVPVRFVVLTHHHTDHALGSSWFAAEGAVVIAHPDCRRAAAAEHAGLIESRRRDPKLAELFSDAVPAEPSLLFASEIAVDLGGIEARVIHPGHGHTPGDAVVFAPGRSVLVAGDLVSNGYHFNYEDAAISVPALHLGLDRLEALGAHTCVPGHGAAGGPELLSAQKEYHRTVERVARQAQSPQSAVEQLRRAHPGFKLEILLPDTARRWAAS